MEHFSPIRRRRFTPLPTLEIEHIQPFVRRAPPSIQTRSARATDIRPADSEDSGAHPKISGLAWNPA